MPSPAKELRRESRMQFPPEVTSFMSLAESPRQLDFPRETIGLPQATPIIVTDVAEPSEGTRASTLSPKSDWSTANDDDGPILAPLATLARKLPTTEEAVKPDEKAESPSKRSPPSHPPRSSSIHSVTALASPIREHFNPVDLPGPSVSGEDTPRPSIDPFAPLTPTLSPPLLPYTRVYIPNSTIFPDSSGRDVLSFILTITVRAPSAPPLTWSVAKLLSAFIDLDTRIKSKSGKSRKELKTMIAPLPDGKAWKDFAPSKIDQRKVALEAYLQSLLAAPLSDKTDLCGFLTSDPVQAKAQSTRKEGYLTKKGKNWGGWKTRYFALDGANMEYFESVSRASVVIRHVRAKL